MSIKKRLTLITCVFMIFVFLTSIGVYLIDSVRYSKSSDYIWAVELNELEHLINSGDKEASSESLTSLKTKLEASSPDKHLNLYILPLIIAAIYVVVVFAYIYKNILKPFDKLHSFASNVASGNLDEPLKQERGQFFGEFTWAFDSMRKEIIKARNSERESIENNKTIIATLSHDIKTPISSIRSYSEALEANLDKTPEKRMKYLHTIIDKCDEVSKLTDDLFLHSVSDMDKMSVVPVRININEFLRQSVPNLNACNNVTLALDTSANDFIMADPQRLLQICENIIGNANKYAPGSFLIKTRDVEDGGVVIIFEDYGKGIPEENLPFITQKFYRGNNIEGIQGSGLGLYIVSYLASKMDARLIIENKYDNGENSGLRIKISFAKVS